MSKLFIKFRDSSLFVVVTIIFPVIAVVATILIYLNSEILRDQSAQHRLELSSLQSRVNEKDAQIVLLNEQIKQKSIQSEILKSQVELLQKINTHHDKISKIDILAVEDKITTKQNEINELNRKLSALEDIKNQFGNAGNISETISNLRSNIDKLELENVSLTNRINIYEPNYPTLSTFELKEGNSKTLLNGKLTIGLVDAYGTWGYIYLSSLGEVLYELEDIRPGKNISIVIQGSHFVIVLDSITEKSAVFTLLNSGK